MSDTALEFLARFEHLPMDFNGNMPIKASKSAVRRWLQNHSVLINGQKPGPFDPVEYPVWQLIFFPKSNRRCTMQDKPPN